MDFIRDILFGDTDATVPTLNTEDTVSHHAFEVTESETQTIENEEADDTVESLPDIVDLEAELLESFKKFKKEAHESWRDKYNRIKQELDVNRNKTDEKKAEEILNRTEKEYNRAYNMMSADWNEYDKALEDFVDKLESAHYEQNEEETVTNIMDFSDEEYYVEKDQNVTEDNSAESLEVNLIEEASTKLQSENNALKIKLEALKRRKRKMKTKETADSQRFIQQVDEMLNAEMTRIQTNFVNLKKENERISQKNEQLKRKVDENDEKIFALYFERDEDRERYKRLILKKNKLHAQKELVKSRFQSVERKNRYLSKEFKEVKLKLDEKLAKNESQCKEYDEKLSFYLKSMNMFKEATEKSLETKVKRLEDINLKLSKDNYELRCKILDQSLHGIMAKSEPNHHNESV